MNTVHVNHLGFRPDDPLKRAIIPLHGQSSGLLGARLCEVVNIGQLIQTSLNDAQNQGLLNLRSTTVERSPLGDFAVCDFSDLTQRGGYQIQHQGAHSYPFQIHRDGWKRCFRLLLEWYRIASCGENVPGYHEACHLDDCRLIRDGEQVDLCGGWHDAGDLRKWTSTMATVTWRLAQFMEEQGSDLSAIAVDEQLVWHQLERGARYLLKCIDPVSHLVWHSVASAADNTCNVWTDNETGSGDERWAMTDTPLDTADYVIRALASTACLLKNRNSELAKQSAAAARQVWNALREPLQKEFGTAALLPAAFELARLEGKDEYAPLVRQGLREILEHQQKTAAFGQDYVRGYFVENGRITGNGDWKHRSGRNLFHMMEKAEHLARALLLWPTDCDAPRWRDGLVLLLEGCIEPMIRKNPYRALPASLYQRGDTTLGGHGLAGDIMFRYFGHEAEGNNAELCDTGAALALSARALGQPRWAALGQKQLEWVLGFNPHEQSMITGIGYSSVAVFSSYVGQITGAIINGYTGDENDAPVLYLQRETAPMNMEYWSVHTASMLRALAVLENEPLS